MECELPGAPKLISSRAQIHDLNGLCAQLVCSMLDANDLRSLSEVNPEWKEQASSGVTTLKPKLALSQATVHARYVLEATRSLFVLDE
jgi:hypothetical protein